MKRWREFHDKSVVHCEAVIAAGEYTLCGFALEGETGDDPMEETRDLINCKSCEAIITYCKRIPPSAINRFSRRRVSG